MERIALLNGEVKSESVDGCDNCERENQARKNQNFSEVERTALIFGQTEEDMNKEFREFKALKLFKKFDFDLTGVKEVEMLNSLLEEVSHYGFGNVVVNPKQIKDAKRKLKGSGVGVYSAISYPFGEELYGVKKYLAKKSFEEGADGVFLPVGISDIKRGRIEQVKREFAKIVRRYKRKKVFAVIEVGEFDFQTCEKIVRSLLKVKVAGFVSSAGFSSSSKNMTSLSNLHSLADGRGIVVAYSDSEKSGDIVNLFSVADRVFVKNATKLAISLKTNLEF